MAELSGDSIRPLLTWRPGDPGPRPGFGGTGDDLRYMQGTVVAWNGTTAENMVRIHGADHVNVPLIDLGVGQRVMQPGDQVAIMSWSPNGGTAAYFIMGRLVVPGSSAAERSEEALASLVAQLAPQVFADRTRTDISTTQASYTSPTSGFVDHSQDEPAIIEDVEVVAGVAIVTVGAGIGITMDSQGSTTGEVGVRVTGPTNVDPSFGRGVFLTVQGSDSGSLGASRQQIHILSPGTYTFETRYRMASLDIDPFVSMAPTELSVIAL